MEYPFSRSIYRIQYPEKARPALTLPAGVVAVVDCSEEGLRYLPAKGPLPELGTVVAGKVKFKSVDSEVAVRGKVIRVQAGEIAIQLESPGVPRAVIFSEQRFIGKRYPQLRGGS